MRIYEKKKTEAHLLTTELVTEQKDIPMTTNSNCEKNKMSCLYNRMDIVKKKVERF